MIQYFYFMLLWLMINTGVDKCITGFGRRKYCYVTVGMSSILSCVSGILQHFDKLSQNCEYLTMATLVVSLLAKMTVTAADTVLIVYTTELYPTVVSFIPESVRWLVSKLKLERAERTIEFVANVNRVHKPDLKNIFETAVKEINTTSNKNKTFTIATLWTSKELRNVTISLCFLWFVTSAAWYGMTLGMESISVNIYLNMFLINLVDVPADALTGPLVNRFGRRKYWFVIVCVSSILCGVSGILQHFDKLTQNSAHLTVATLVVSLLAKMTVTTASTALIIYTTEMYPTVVRTTGYGFQATFGRLGAVASPLLIHLCHLNQSAKDALEPILQGVFVDTIKMFANYVGENLSKLA
ncbi:solute carrier family 22 member 21-like [Mercenaria mercenaria]|uniref:solute carrier family 22 member 21-like n=1 Tax=Mercenaria mercenaria TaxID=6596 RepID=UPI00234F1285|nr:solute carrier family 22 member 21-like [Mercenaria mercenaria]